MKWWMICRSQSLSPEKVVIRMLDEFKVNLAYRTISAPIAGLTTDLLIRFD